MDFYEDGDLHTIVERSAGLLGVQLEHGGAAEIAKRSRGTPRVTNRLLRRVRDFSEVHGRPVIDQGTAHAALDLYEVDELGLDRLDRAVLGALLRTFRGGPVGLSTLAVAIGEEPETVESVAEPFLVRAGLIFRTPRGRMATPAAWAHLGLPDPSVAAGFAQLPLEPPPD
jgi:Holliday junction DNA helicase RuvB